MALKEYKKKRSFVNTPEPQGGRPDGKTLQFVVQKHAASHLHYDFRLEMDGVLKSWAIPKGPSLNPADKRLAMQVEDHPFDYKDFEGIIPPGNYGAGTVMVWDEGTYEALEETNGTKAAQEKALMKQLRDGSLKFRLNGKKLKGEFALVRTKGRGENSWLLIKHRDRFASDTPVTDKDKSVISKKTLEQIAANPRSRQWSSNRQTAATKSKSTATKASPTKSRSAKTKPSESKPVKSKSAKTKPSESKPPKPTPSIPPSAPKKPMPKDLSPMLATLVDKPFDDEGWSYEIKWDGYRALAYLQKGKVELRSRNNKTFEKYYPIYTAFQQWPLSALLDGEIVVLNEKGQSNFGDLQNWRSEADGTLVYYVFDLLWLEGRDLTGLPLSERRALLQSIVPPGDVIRYSDSFETGGKEFFAKAQELGLEGIMAKRADSLYTPGARTREWLKVKTASRQEVVIGGFTRNEDSPKLFSALLVGVFKDGRLQYTGKVGTGYTEQMQRDMMKRFQPLIRKESPFTTVPDINQPSRFRPNPPEATATWLKPVLVGEVAFREMTTDGVMRQPSFQGMREDKDAKEVVRETALPTQKVVEEEDALSPAAAQTRAAKPGAAKPGAAAKPKPAASRPRKSAVADKVLTPLKKKDRGTLLNPADETQTRKVNGHDLSFTHLSKIFWPKEKYTKRDLINYYYQVAPYILPWLKDRPQSLNRHPNGINAPGFYQKNVSGKVPGWITTFPYHSEGDNEDKEFLVCTDEASLLYMISLGCIELNPWSSRTASPDNPDWCIIDLDPDKKTPFEKVIEAAQVTKKILDAAGITSYCKTSGSTGLHIYFPLGAKYTYEHSKEFARVVVQHVHNEIPGYTTIERMTSQRKGRMYLDFLQNRPQATIAAPYSVRPKPGATVSAPLHWDEVKKGMTTRDFTILNMPARVNEMGDLFKPVLGKGIDMEKALGKLNAL
ncbi:MAG TPA: DNA ligase D [Puia sp.]|jgi:bifunctional non-homologous end joining protein LigD|nr:DNA ligase D [Puia sp.]